MDVGLIYHPDYLKHDPGAHHPERAQRLMALWQVLTEHGYAHRLLPFAGHHDPLAWIARVHHSEHIAQVQAACRRGRGALDPDTVVCADSYAVALKAVAGALEAADAIMRGQVAHVFCAVRPPGHHAEAHRAMGFCLFNTVAILARYLQQQYGMEKILIVDWDVHHGNGTQHIFEDDPSVFYCSVHQYPLYPGTGAATETGVGRGKGYTLNMPLPPESGDETYLAVFAQQLLPRALAYAPDCVLISAGFDAHYADPLAQMQVTEAGFRRMTTMVKEIAATCSQHRIISLLEGGYNLEALGRCVIAHLEALQYPA